MLAAFKKVQVLSHLNIRATGCFQQRWVSKDVPGDESTHQYHPNYLEKKILVWTKTYPSFEKVPNTVRSGSMKIARDKFRAKILLWSCVIFTVGLMSSVFVANKLRKKRNEENFEFQKIA